MTRLCFNTGMSLIPWYRKQNRFIEYLFKQISSLKKTFIQQYDTTIQQNLELHITDFGTSKIGLSSSGVSMFVSILSAVPLCLCAFQLM